MRIDLKRRFQIGMTEDRLSSLDGLTRSAQQSGMNVPEGVPSNMGQLQGVAGRLNYSFKNVVGAKRCPAP